MLRVALLTLLPFALMGDDPQPPQAPATPTPQVRPPRERPESLANRRMPVADPNSKKSTENKVICRIGKEVYRESDFDVWLSVVVSQPAQLMQLKSSPQQMKQLQRQYMEILVLEKQAKADHVEKTPEFKAKRVALEKQLMVTELILKKQPEIESSSTPTEEQLLAYYEENKNSFKSEEKATARHILVKVEADKMTDEAALKKMALVKKELQGGKSWVDVAKESSDDPGSKDNGGLYENFDPARMVPEFAQAVRTQAIGEIGEPVKTQFGYHLILVESFTPSKTRTFEEVKGNIQGQLGAKLRSDAWVGYIDSLKKQYKFEEEIAPDSKVSTTGSAGKISGD